MVVQANEAKAETKTEVKPELKQGIPNLLWVARWDKEILGKLFEFAIEDRFDLEADNPRGKEVKQNKALSYYVLEAVKAYIKAEIKRRDNKKGG